MMESVAKTSARRLALITTLALGALLPLAACGKKPNMVDAPPGVVDDSFPRAYPDTSTDPDATIPAPAKPKYAPAPKHRAYF